MTKFTWAKITSILIILYGALLLFQAFWPGWDEVQEGCALDIAKIVGGVVFIGWGIVFFWMKGRK